MMERDISYITPQMIYTIVHKSAYQAKEMAMYFSIDLEEFKKKHSDKIIFELLKK